VSLNILPVMKKV